MKMFAIIKDAFLFPSKKTGRFAIYLLLGVFAALFVIGGVLTNLFGLIDGKNYLLGGIYLVIALLISWLISGYHIKIIKSGIKQDDDIPAFELFNDFMTGFDNFVVMICYAIIPALIIILVGYDTNLFANIFAFCREFLMQAFNVFIMGTSASAAVSALNNIGNNILNSLSITISVAMVLFLIFTILYFMAEARLAHTGSVRKALNIYQAAKDIKRIGIAKTIISILVIILIIFAIETLLILVLNAYPFLLSSFFIILAPYFVLVGQRAIGLLYSDIV